MAQFDELITVLKELLNNRFYPKPEYQSAVLGDGVGNVEVPDKPDKHYVRYNRGASQYFEVLNRTTPPVHDLPVKIGSFPHQPGLIQVVDVDWDAYEQVGWDGKMGSTSPHAPTHIWRDGFIGADPLDVYLRAIAPARAYTTSATGSIVYVNSFEYHTGTVWPGTPGVDLSPIMSATSTGSARFAGIYVKPGNTLGVVTGTTDVDTIAFDPPLVTFPWGTIPIARVRIYGGQAGLGEADFREARRLFDFPFTGTVGSGEPTGDAGGDLTGTYPDPRVAGLHGYPLIDTAPAAGDILMFTGSIWRPIPFPADSDTGENLIYHSLHYDIWQGGTTFNDVTDDTYVADLWNVVHNGQAPDITGEAATTGDDFERCLRVTFDSASSQAGLLQFISAADTKKFRNKNVSLSFDAWGTDVANLRATVIIWVGTADSLTSDPINTWAANPTLVSNWEYSVGHTPPSGIDDIAITGTKTRYSAKTDGGISIPDDANNLAVFIWTPDEEGSGDLFNVANVKLEIGDEATGFTVGTFTEEKQLRVQHFYEVIGGEETLQALFIGRCTSTTASFFVFRYRPKVKDPAFTVSDITHFSVTTAGGGTAAASSGAAQSIAEETARFNVNVASGLVAGNATELITNTTDARLTINSRL